MPREDKQTEEEGNLDRLYGGAGDVSGLPSELDFGKADEAAKARHTKDKPAHQGERT